MLLSNGHNTIILLPTSSRNYLINITQLCMQTAHQNSHYHCASWAFGVCCHMVAQPAGWCICMPFPASLCIGDEEFDWIWMLLIVGSAFLFFSLWVTQKLAHCSFHSHAFSPHISHSSSLYDRKMFAWFPTFRQTMNDFIPRLVSWLF